jgi:hydrogenase-4 membrane subunit HyfE
VLDLAPPSLALLPQSHGPYAALLVIGFVVGILGQLFRQRWLIVTGILLIVLGALLLPLAAGLPGSDKPPAGHEQLPLEPGE